MSLPQPKFETRTYRDLYNEAIARIAAHTPEWTNRSEPDPGVTLLQLFAFMTESLLYRTNLIPERNRQKFLRLLQIPMRPAAAASGLVSFSNPRGPFDVYILNANLSLAAGSVSFRTDSGLAVLPIESRIYYKKPVSTTDDGTDLTELYNNLYAAFDLPDKQLEFYETTVFEPAASGTNLKSIDIARETVDGTLWLALLARSSESPDQAREKIANTVLSLGLFPAIGEEGCSVEPVPAMADTPQPLVFELPNAADQRIRYEPLDYSAEHDLMKQPGVVKIRLPAANKLTTWAEEALTAGVDNRPPSLENTDDQDRLITWLRIRAPQVDTTADVASRQLSIKLSWCGINAADIGQRSNVTGEKLSDGTGKPDQVVRLLNRPVIDSSLRLYVNGELWKEIDDLAAAPSELDCGAASNLRPNADVGSNRVYQLDREAGEIRFGNGTFGARPANGALIQAAYSHGGGLQGMVGIGTIQKAPSLPSGLKVSNPVPTWGGTAAESVADAERNIPQTIRHAERLISEQDFKDIVLRTPGVTIGRVVIRPLLNPRLPRQTSAGSVTVLVIPEFDAVHPHSPEPDQFMLENVCRYLSPRRVLTTELHVRGPVYKEVWISVGLNVVAGFDPSPVREAVKSEIQAFLSPLVGGFSGAGWPLEKTVDALEISAAVTRVDGVSKVNGLLIAESTGPNLPEISMEGLNLPRVMKIAVVEGDPQSIEDIRGDNEALDSGTGTDSGAGSGSGSGAGSVVPVPVIPTQC